MVVVVVERVAYLREHYQLHLLFHIRLLLVLAALVAPLLEQKAIHRYLAVLAQLAAVTELLMLPVLQVVLVLAGLPAVLLLLVAREQQGKVMLVEITEMSAHSHQVVAAGTARRGLLVRPHNLARAVRVVQTQ
jgi:hypothetical protein